MAILFTFPPNKSEPHFNKRPVYNKGPRNTKQLRYTLGHVKFQYPRRFCNIHWI